MSKNDMVMVSRELAEAILGNAAQGYFSKDHGDGLRKALKAEQHQSEPVELPQRMEHADTRDHDAPVEIHNATVAGWNACLDEIAKLGPLFGRPVYGEPVAVFSIDATGYRVRILESATSNLPADGELLYTHANPVEVERHIERRMEMAEQKTELYREVERLRAQLAKRDAELSEIKAVILAAQKPIFQYRELNDETYALYELLRRFLSASAEPSAPTLMPSYMEAACDKFDWTPEEALRFYAEGKHFDTDNGRTRILCTGAIASHALKGMSKEYADFKGAEQGEPSAPVEIDERAAPKPDAWRAAINGNWEYFRTYEQALKELHEWQSDYTPEDLEEAMADGRCEPEPVYARSALERKP